MSASMRYCIVLSGTGAVAGNAGYGDKQALTHDAFDAFFTLRLIVTLSGTQEVVDYYTALLATMKDRVARGIGAVPNEKYRLLWDNIPIWHRMKWLSEKFASHNACLVADTYTIGVVRHIEIHQRKKSSRFSGGGLYQNLPEYRR